MFKHILVPTDFSASANNALGVAVDIAKKFESRITLIHVCETPAMAYMGMITVDVVTPIQDAARESLKQAFDALKSRHGMSDSSLVFGAPAIELLAAIEKQNPGLVVMGTHGRTGFIRFLLGSVAERVVRTSPIPVLTVRQP